MVQKKTFEEIMAKIFQNLVKKTNKRNPNQLLTKKLGEICFIVTYEKNRQDFKWQDTQFWLAVMCAQYNRRLVSGD